MYEELEEILHRLLGLIYRKETLSGKIQTILKEDWLQNKENLLDVNQIDIDTAAKTVLKEALIKSEKKRRFLLDSQLVINTIILNLIEKTSLKYNLVKLASCLVPKHTAENRETSTNRFRLMVDGLSSHKKITSKIADNAVQFIEMEKVVCEKHFDEFIKFDYLKDRLDIFQGKIFFWKGRFVACVNFHSFPWAEFY